MQYSMVAVAALVAGASAGYNVSYTTEVVDSYTTFCPGATQITHAEKTYTVTEATLLTITNCPCTLTKPVSSVAPVTSVSVAPAPVVSTSAAPVVSSVTPVVVSSVAPVTSVAPPVFTSASVVAPIYVNSTAPTVAPAGTAAPSTVVTSSPSPSAFKGAATNLAASGFSLAGVLAIAAYLL